MALEIFLWNQRRIVLPYGEPRLRVFMAGVEKLLSLHKRERNGGDGAKSERSRLLVKRSSETPDEQVILVRSLSSRVSFGSGVYRLPLALIAATPLALITRSALLSGQSRGRRAAESSACDSLAWMRSSDLQTPGGRRVALVNAAPVVPLRQRYLVLGRPTVVLPDSAMIARGMQPSPQDTEAVGVLSDSLGKVSLVPRPQSAIEMLNPVTTALRSRSAATIWGEHSASGVRSPMIAQALWYSEFDGARWQTPLRIASADEIRWNNSSSALAVVGDDVVVAAPAVDSAQNWVGMLVLRRWGKTWSQVRLPTASYPTYVAIVSNNRGRMLLLYAARVPPPHRGEATEYALLSQASHDAGRSWAKPHVIKMFDKDDGYALRATETSHDRVVIVTSSKPSDDAPTALYTMTSDDWLSWRPLQPFESRTQIADIDVVSARDNVVAMLQSRGDGGIAFLSIRNGTWQSTRSGHVKSSTALATIRSDNDTLVVSSVARDQPGSLPSSRLAFGVCSSAPQ